MEHEMVTDKPSWQHRRHVHYGSLQDNARRSLTAAEIDWNDELLTSSLRCLSKIHFRRCHGVLPLVLPQGGWVGTKVGVGLVPIRWVC